MFEIPCVILCGGKSSRMGSNKALLPWGDSILVQEIFQKYSHWFKEVYCSCKDVSVFAHFCSAFILENGRKFAPLVGICSSLEILKQSILVTTTDCPFLQKAHFQKLLLAHQASPQKIIYAKTAYQAHYLIGIYPIETLPILKQFLQKGEFKMSKILHAFESEEVFFEDEESFSNLNTPEEYQNLKGRFDGTR